MTLRVIVVTEATGLLGRHFLRELLGDGDVEVCKKTAKDGIAHKQLRAGWNDADLLCALTTCT